jgi:hypothetical protein
MPVDVAMFDEMAKPLLKFYEDAEARLSQLMGRATMTAFDYRRSQLLLQQIDSIVRGLEEKQRGWSQRYLPRAYRQGMSLTAASFRLPLLPAMTLMDRRSIEVAVARTMAETSEALNSIAPFVKQVWVDTQQRLVAEQQIAHLIAEGRIEGLGPRELGRRIRATLQDGASGRLEGVVSDTLRADLEATARGEYIGITCRDGKFRRYNLKSYSETVAQTATRQAASEGAIASTVAVGGDLVQISVHSGACPECEAIQGNVYSLTGETEGFPILADEDDPPIHPHCEHVLIGVDADFLRERGAYENLQAFSSNPDRTVASVGEYQAVLHA